MADVYHDLPDIPRGTVKYAPDFAAGGLAAMTRAGHDAVHDRETPWTAAVRLLGLVARPRDRRSGCGGRWFGLFPRPGRHGPLLSGPRRTAHGDPPDAEQRHLSPGECRGCVGCHESQAKTPWVGGSGLLALHKPPQHSRAAALGRRQDARLRMARPADAGSPLRALPRRAGAGRRTRLLRDKEADGFIQSFRTMFGLAPGQDKPAGAGWWRWPIGSATRASRSPGSSVRTAAPWCGCCWKTNCTAAKSPLSDHEWRTLVTWVDANAPYHDKFLNRRPPDGGPPRRHILARQLPPRWAGGGKR